MKKEIVISMNQKEYVYSYEVSSCDEAINIFKRFYSKYHKSILRMDLWYVDRETDKEHHFQLLLPPESGELDTEGCRRVTDNFGWCLMEYKMDGIEGTFVFVVHHIDKEEEGIDGIVCTTKYTPVKEASRKEVKASVDKATKEVTTLAEGTNFTMYSTIPNRLERERTIYRAGCIIGLLLYFGCTFLYNHYILTVVQFTVCKIASGIILIIFSINLAMNMMLRNRNIRV